MLLDKIKNLDRLPSKGQLIDWVKLLPNTSLFKKKPTENKVGDVYLHPIFKHPYILIKKKKEGFICCLLTSDATFPDILCETDSRFFPENFISKMIFFTSTVPGTFMGVYENQKQLREIYKQLKIEF